MSRLSLRQRFGDHLAPLLVLLLCALLIFSNLGVFRDFVRAESYFALGAQLMVAERDWLAPHAPDEPVLNKPPLQYWLTGAGYELFGASYATARLPSALAALALLIVLYLLAVKLYDRRAGLFAAGCLMTSYLFYTFARTAMSDMLLSLCVTCALACFIQVLTGRGARHEWQLALCGHLFVGLGVLSKGPVAVVLVAGPLLLEILLSRDLSALKRLRVIHGALIILGVAGPYFLLLYLRHGLEPLRSFFIGENLQRFTGEIYAYATVPFWRLPLSFVSDFAPWSLLLFPALYAEWRGRSLEAAERRARRLVTLWLFFPLLFFSFSHFKLDYYLLPSMPAAALLVGGFMSRLSEQQRALRAATYIFVSLFALLMIAASVASLRFVASLRLDAGFAWLAVASSACALLFALYSLYKGWTGRAAWSLIFSIWSVLLLHQLTVAPALSRFQPVERVAASVPPATARVYTSFATSDWANTLAFHLPRGVKLARLVTDRDGSQLLEILKDEAGAIALVTEAEFERLTASGLSLQTLAEGETFGHGGLTLGRLRHPATERLRLVQKTGP